MAVIRIGGVAVSGGRGSGGGIIGVHLAQLGTGSHLLRRGSALEVQKQGAETVGGYKERRRAIPNP